MNCYTKEEVATHNKIDDCWLIANNKVYDVTEFLFLHPGGICAILRHAGSDQTVSWKYHSIYGRNRWKSYIIGYISSDCCIIL